MLLGHRQGDRRLRWAATSRSTRCGCPGLVAHQEVLLGGPGQLLTIRHDATSARGLRPGRAARAGAAELPAAGPDGRAGRAAVKLDHCVIAVSNWDRSNPFYRDVLGAELIEIDSAVLSLRRAAAERARARLGAPPAGRHPRNAGKLRPLLRLGRPIKARPSTCARTASISSSGRCPEAGPETPGQSLLPRSRRQLARVSVVPLG